MHQPKGPRAPRGNPFQALLHVPLTARACRLLQLQHNPVPEIQFRPPVPGILGESGQGW